MLTETYRPNFGILGEDDGKLPIPARAVTTNVARRIHSCYMNISIIIIVNIYI